jgi:alkylhydroperoxidase family enzyme
VPIIHPITNEEASDELKAIFDASEERSGSSMMMRTFAHQPQLLQDFSQFYQSIWKGTIDPKLREMSRYRAAIVGQCDY